MTHRHHPSAGGARRHSRVRHQRLRGPAVCCLPVRDDRGRHRGTRWIGRLLPSITSTGDWPEKGQRVRAPNASLNVCFTADGLRACGLTDNVLCTFPTEFREGIATPARSRILGDTEASDPSRWEFGRPGADPLHALIIIHGRTESELMAACTQQRDLIDQSDRAVAELAIEPQRGVRPVATTSRSGSTMASRNRRFTGSRAPACRPASSSWAT